MDTKSINLALRCANAAITLALLAGFLTIWNDNVFQGMVLKPFLMLAVLATAGWMHERLGETEARQPARRAYATRGADRRRRPRAAGRDRRVRHAGAMAAGRA